MVAPLIVDTAGEDPKNDIGLVAVIPVGMANVSSVNMTMTKGSIVQKGDEFGYFLFGGSDIIVLFQPRANAQILKNPSKPPTPDFAYFHYGIKIATCKPA
ncbi:MAG: phosphatidylserine decarboxylase [Pseudonocardiaceae bacterium]